jgi:hypothetical protein
VLPVPTFWEQVLGVNMLRTIMLIIIMMITTPMMLFMPMLLLVPMMLLMPMLLMLCLQAGVTKRLAEIEAEDLTPHRKRVSRDLTLLHDA